MRSFRSPQESDWPCTSAGRHWVEAADLTAAPTEAAATTLAAVAAAPLICARVEISSQIVSSSLVAEVAKEGAIIAAAATTLTTGTAAREAPALGTRAKPGALTILSAATAVRAARNTRVAWAELAEVIRMAWAIRVRMDRLVPVELVLRAAQILVHRMVAAVVEAAAILAVAGAVAVAATPAGLGAAAGAAAGHPTSSRVPRSSEVGKAGRTRLATDSLSFTGNE